MRSAYLLLIICILQLSTNSAFSAKRALLVSIDEYFNTEMSLKGCRNDLKNMFGVLTEQLDFQPEYIETLVDEQATKNNILTALNRAKSILKPTDSFVFFYSGHGSLLQDQNGDEFDGWDEVLCPYETNLNIPDSMIRDDTLKNLFNDFPSKRNLLIFDSCHSGTITRSIKDKNIGKTALIKFLHPENRLLKSRNIKVLPSMAEMSSNAVVISAARSDQKAVIDIIDGDFHSIMTYFLSRGLRGEGDLNRNGRISYIELLDYIRKKASRYSSQQVQIEGPADELKKDIIVFNNTTQPPDVLGEILNLSGDRSDFGVEVWVTEKDKTVFNKKDPLRFRVISEKSGYLTLINIDPKEEISILYPNKYSKSSWIEKNTIKSIPNMNAKFTLTAEQPYGIDTVIAVVSTQQMASDFFLTPYKTGIFRTFKPALKPSFLTNLSLNIRGIGVNELKNPSFETTNRLEWGLGFVNVEVRP